MNQATELDLLSAAELKRTLENLPPPERYAEIMRRVGRGETISVQFRFFVSYYEANLGINDEERTFKVTAKMFRDHAEWIQMMKKRWKLGGCGNILPFEKP